MKKVAIIGAGMSGLSAAQALAGRAEVTVFDKSRGIGGRMSTRYAGDYEFDHGAQYFTVQSPEFTNVVNKALSQGHVAPWAARAKYLKDGIMCEDTGGARFVAQPRMNSWTKALATGLNVQVGKRVMSMSRSNNKTWTLTFEDGETENGFDAVISTIPPTQVLDILPKNFSGVSDVKRAKMDVCFALMLGFKAPLKLSWDTLRLNNLPIGWISVNSAKPGRGPASTLIIHSAPEWSNAHVESDRDWVESVLLKVGSEIIGQDLSSADHIALHRWLYSSVSQGVGKAVIFDKNLNIALCGDWCVGGRVEGAFLSGLAAAEALNF